MLGGGKKKYIRMVSMTNRIKRGFGVGETEAGDSLGANPSEIQMKGHLG